MEDRAAAVAATQRLVAVGVGALQVVRVPMRVGQVEDFKRGSRRTIADAWRRRFGHRRQQDLPLVVGVEGVVAGLAEHEAAHLLRALVRGEKFEAHFNIIKKDFLIL